MKEYERPKITATMPKNTSRETLLQCRKYLDRIRVHTAKMTSEEVIALIRRCYKVGLQTMVDLSGVKVRTKETPGMKKDTDPGEGGNMYVPLEIEETVTLIPIGFTDKLIADKFDIQKNKCLRASYIPTQLKVNDTVTFSDGEIICEVVETPEIDAKRCLKLQVKELSGEKGIYWNMGMGSPSKDLFSGHRYAITKSDELVLKAIQEAGIQHMVKEIAVSFVAEPEHLERTRETLKKYGFDLVSTRIVAKIETIEAVENIEDIIEKINQLTREGVNVIIEIGRGDLGDDCRAKEVDLNNTEKTILEAAKKGDVPVIIATGVAGSALEGFRERATFEGLTSQERRQIIQEVLYKVVIGFMLAAETMITGDLAPDVIRSVRNALNQAESFRREYYLPWQDHRPDL